MNVEAMFYRLVIKWQDDEWRHCHTGISANSGVLGFSQKPSMGFWFNAWRCSHTVDSDCLDAVYAQRWHVTFFFFYPHAVTPKPNVTSAGSSFSCQLKRKVNGFDAFSLFRIYIQFTAERCARNQLAFSAQGHPTSKITIKSFMVNVHTMHVCTVHTVGGS